MFERINIYEELVKEKKKSFSLLDEANSILKSETEKDESILNRIQHQKPILNPSTGEGLLSDASDIFSLQQIKSISIKYRLRFLDSKLFKGEIPYEAIVKVKELEKKHKVKFSEFKILAPASLFKLEDRNKDPFLFAKVSSFDSAQGDSHCYLLIHKWGNNLNWYRKILAFPLRTAKNFILTMLVISLLISLAMPVDYSTRMFIFLLSNLFFLSMFAHIGYMRLNQNFSEFEWDSKFVN